jgi:oligosaccharide repeat unit polymerase
MLFLGHSLNLTRLTLPSVLIIAYIFLMSVPSIKWFCDSTYHIRYTYFLAVQSVPILLSLGVRVANVFFRHPSKTITGFLSSSLSKTRRDSFAFLFYILLFFLSILIIAAYILTSDYVPLLGSLVKYGEMSSELVRSSIYREPDTIQYAHALTVRFFLPFCLLYSYFMAYVYKGRWKYLFWITLLLTLFASLLTFERVYVMSLFIFLILAFYLKNNRLLLKANFIIFSLAIFVSAIISRTQYNLPLDLKSIWNTLIRFFIRRIWLDPSYMAYIHFEKFNDTATFLHGKSIRLLSLFGVEFHHTVSPSFVAELWINFGWFGVIIGTIIIGFILQLIQLMLFRKKSILTLIIYTMLLLNAVWLIYGHVLSTMVVSVYLLSVIFLFFLLPIVEGAVGGRRCLVPRISHPNISKVD